MRVIYWELSSSCPVLDFIENQPPGAGAKMQKIIDYFAEEGMRLLGTSLYLKRVVGYPDLYELRIAWKGIAYRILMVVKGATAWLVHAFRKTKQKIQQQHLKLAMQRRTLIINYAMN